ncbi:MAG: hypothetical protein IJ213_06385 [Bacteroidales bacterium]|nr:hypothetical protein [Bacteroidales bacterium]
MRKIVFLTICCLATIFAFGQNKSSNIEIGQWRDHLSYYMSHNVAKVGDKVLVACGSSLFYYDTKTKTMDKLSKVNGLSDAGLGVVAYDSVSGSIVITYENSNIDIVQKDKIFNIPDIKNRFIEGSKEINSIYFSNNKAYLSCGFGVVVIDLLRHEIYDTWYLGENSSAINVNCVYINDTSIFAGTVNGLLYADKNSTTLAAGEAWHKKEVGNSASTSFITREINYILPLGNDIIISALSDNDNNSIVFRYNGEDMDTVGSFYLINMKTFGDKLAMINWLSFTIYDEDFNQYYHISDQWNPIPGVSPDFFDVIIDGEDLWFAHHYSGLVYVPKYKENNLWSRECVFPQGPLTNNVYNLIFDKYGLLYLSPGGKDITSGNRYIEGYVDIYDGNWWFRPETQTYMQTYEGERLLDILNVTIDPYDRRHFMASSWWNGVLEFRNDTLINIFDITNTDSVITPYTESYRIIGVLYDASGNLLIGNSLSSNAFAYLNYHGQWGSFLTTSFLNNTADELEGITEDIYNHYKILYTKSNKILIMNNNEDIRFINPNNGSLLTTDRVNCMVQDQDGEIWIGTEKGIKVIYSLDNAFSSAGQTAPTECNNIIYDEHGIADYLLRAENIQCIMVDGANRKWIGTESNGIYVISANGDKELHHFTIENSPLLSGKVVCMAQNPSNGEVFIGTDRGLISYRTESLYTNNEKQGLKTYPNPVREDYEGMIAIRGFVKDSDVRITDAQGRMVAHIKSLGGQAVWDGRNFNGQKVGSGVYYIFSSANEGKTTAVGKFMIIK